MGIGVDEGLLLLRQPMRKMTDVASCPRWDWSMVIAELQGSLENGWS